MIDETKYPIAVREGVGLLISVIGGTGSGKTYSAMELATGLSEGKPFAVVDSDNKRALFYADRFRFHHRSVRAPFRPDAFLKEIRSLDEAGFPAIVIDTLSLGWYGDGGILDWHEEILDKLTAGKVFNNDADEDRARARLSQKAWIEPKMAYKRFVSDLLQIRAHLVFALRAEEKTEQVKNEKGYTEFRPMERPTGRDGWIPVCEKKFPYEMTASFLVKLEERGVPLPIKLGADLAPYIDLKKPLSRETGEALARWARGESEAVKVMRTAVLVAMNEEELKLAAANAEALVPHERDAFRSVYRAKLMELRANAPKTIATS